MTKIRSKESYKENGFQQNGLLEVAYRRSYSDETSKMKINKCIAKNKNTYALVNECDTEDNTTPLIHFAKKGFSKSIKKLLTHDAQVNAIDIHSDTALHYVAIINTVNCAKHLLNFHANPNIQNQQGDTPLMIAAKYGSSQVFKLLINDAKVDVNIKNQEGKTAIDLFAKRLLSRLENITHTMLEKSFSCLRSLLETGANFSQVENKEKIYELLKSNASKYKDASACLSLLKPQNSSSTIYSALVITPTLSTDKVVLEMAPTNPIQANANVIQQNQDKEEQSLSRFGLR